MITEAEIWDCLRTNFRLAAEHCDDLAKLPAQGPTYQLLLGELSLIEGACRQAAHWREDAGGVTLPPGQPGAHGFEAVRLGETDSAGWLDVAHMMGEVHKRCGGWIRGRYPRELFQKMAQQRAVAIDNPSGPRDALEFIETQMDYELSAIDGNVRRIYEAMQAPIPAQAEE
jgi:hypothetical protein